MEGWISTVSALRLLAVFFILAAAFSRSSKLALIIALSVIASAVVMHLATEGFSGLSFSLFGAAAATLFTLPLYGLKRIDITELVISCAAGTILGPMGCFTALLIAFILYAVQRLSRANISSVLDRFISSKSISDPGFLIEDEKSALAEIEAKKILRSDCGDPVWPSLPCTCTRDNTGSLEEQRLENILPWRINMALTTLAALMIGFPT
jgi:hypothetical protein